MAKKTQGTIASMDAKEQLYGRRMTVSRAMRDVLKWEAIYGVLTLTLIGFHFPHFLFVIPVLILVFLWVWRSLLPKKVEQAYQMQSYSERNQFVNLVTQEMSTHTITMQAAIKDAMNNASGEFRDDISNLSAVLAAGSNRKTVHKAFLRIQKKYETDIYFARFMEQCETVYWETEYHIESFETFKDSHNMVLEKKNLFRANKKSREQQMYMMLGLCEVMNVIVVNISASVGASASSWGDSYIGNGISLLWVVIVFIIISMFYKNFFDDSVLSF